METPPKATHFAQLDRSQYTPEEKQQLLANLDLEVEHRTRQFEASLADILENFRNHHEGQVLRVPRFVRNITMAEFGDKYNGDINECLKGLQVERHGGEPAHLDAIARKRKWQESQDETGTIETDSTRASKNARMHQTPKSGQMLNAKTPRMAKTPAMSRMARTPAQLISPVKQVIPKRALSPSKVGPSTRPPSTNFNPSLPTAPSYPRLPRQNESFLSVNGSPLAMPTEFMRYTADDREVEPPDGQPSLTGRDGGKRPSILIRQDTSQSFRRPDSQASIYSNPSYPSQTSRAPHSRTNSQTTQNHSRSNSQASLAQSHSTSSTQHPPTIIAFVRVPTTDGHVLEFDPLTTAPEELDALQGITASAKKQAKDDMTRLVHAALAKWKI